MEDIKKDDRIVYKEPQLFGNMKVLRDGQVLNISGSSAEVKLDGEESSRMIPIDKLTKSVTIYGSEQLRPNEYPVIDGIRR